MGTAKLSQTNFTNGVYDPKLAAREDEASYYNALSDAKNLIVIPQGGVTRRPGKQWLRELAPVLVAVDLSGATITAPQGGTADNLKDGDQSTYVTTSGNIGSTNPFIVAHLDLVAAVTVTAIDIINYKLSSGALSDEFFVEYSNDDSVWTNFGTAFDWDATDRSRRQRNAGGAVSLRYLRIVRIGATATAATASIAEIKLWAETATLSESRLIPFANSTEEAYMKAVSDVNIDVMRGGDYQGSVAVPYLSADLAAINYTQSIDTLLIFRKNIRPWKIFRQGDGDEFDFRSITFTHTPQYDYGAGVGGVNEVQSLNDGGLTANGDKFTIQLEGQRTTTITANTTRATTATHIQTALNALPNAAGGITVADASDSLGFVVTFAGADGKQQWSLMDVSSMSGNAVWSVSEITKGVVPGEDIMSDARGWPRCGLFHQARLNLGGILGVPDGWLASVLGQYYNFDESIDDDTAAVRFRAENDQVSAIYMIVVGRDLTFFTSDAEFYNPTAAINSDAVMKWQTGAGSKEGMRVHRTDGALVSIQGVMDEQDDNREIATSVREFVFDVLQQSYKSNLVSAFSGHLLNNPVDSAYQKALKAENPDLIIIVNEDGTGVNYTRLADQNVRAFMPMTLRDVDKIKNCGVDQRRRVYFITERIINGAARRYIEMWNENLFLDCGGIVAITAQEITAAFNQAVYVWTFDNPSSADAIGVRLNGARLDPNDYAVDLLTKTVTLSADVAATVKAGDAVRLAQMIKTVPNLGHLNGEFVDTFIDGTQGGQFRVTDNALTLDDYADTEIQYGFDFEVYGRLMPARSPGQETLAGEPLRCATVVLNLFETSGIEIRANLGDWRELDLIKTDDDVLDRSVMELLYTGEYREDGLMGCEVGAPFEFRQPGPGPFTLLGVVREVEA